MNIVWLAMKLLQNRDRLAKIKELFPGLDQEQPVDSSVSDQSIYPVGGVSWLQDSLNMLTDAELEVDGAYGPLTQQAVKDYQEAHGLVVDGLAGPETVSSIVAGALGVMHARRWWHAQPPMWQRILRASAWFGFIIAAVVILLVLLKGG